MGYEIDIPFKGNINSYPMIMYEGIKMKIIVIDFETMNREVDLRKVGAFTYIHHDAFYPLCVSWSEESEDEVHHIDLLRHKHEIAKIIKEKILRGRNFHEIMFAAWNIGFDQIVFEKFIQGSYQWIDIQAVAAYFNLPLDLDTCAGILLSQRKMEGGNVLVKELNRGSRDPDSETTEDLLNYCDQDVLLEKRLLEILPWDLLPAWEQKTFYATEKINLDGIQVDTNLAESLIKAVDWLKDQMLNECRNLYSKRFVRLDFSSARRFLYHLETLGFHAPNSQWPVLQELMRTHPLGSAIAPFLETKRIIGSTFPAKFNAIINMSQIDGRVHGLFRYHATHTGRWASSGVQFQNLKRTSKSELPILLDAIDLMAWNDYHGLYKRCGESGITMYDIITQMIRPCFIPDDDELFIVADYTGIEARMAVWLADDQEHLKLYREGGDPYCEIASMIYGREITATDETERAVGKVAVLGGQYGMKGSTFESAYNDILKQGGVTGDQVVARFREAYPKFSSTKQPYGIWSQYVNAFKLSMKNQPAKAGKCEFESFLLPYHLPGELDPLGCTEIKLPSGRSIFFWNPQIFDGWKIQYTRLQDPACRFYKASGKFNLVTTHLHGGKILENVASGLSRDLLCFHLIKLHEYNFKVRGLIHDEVVISIPKYAEKTLVKDIREILTSKPLWLKEFPLDVELFSTTRYAKAQI